MILERPDKHKIRWEKWKAEAFTKGIQGISKENSNSIIAFLKDMELGVNISSKSSKGGRSPRRLSDLKDKMIFFSKNFEQLFKIQDLTKLDEKQAFDLFYRMKYGDLKRKDGKRLQIY